jgi:DNA processing protein
VTEQLVTEAVRAGLTIVSGLARGIDSLAHQAALNAGGRTIAVQGCGLDTIYPPENRGLARAIVDKDRGALISEYPLGTGPEARNFPPRNRLICGLSLGVLVVEAGHSSGALLTTKYAEDQDREIFAVPGNITNPNSAGVNSLIKRGAKLVQGIGDILEELNVRSESPAATPADSEMGEPLTAEEAALLMYLSDTPMHVDELSAAIGLPAPAIAGELLTMELKGLVLSAGPMTYVAGRKANQRQPHGVRY